ncbi:MAG: chalcone isomerase family protein [Alphaproteobacteria bacterium]|nr:chalcone isomerase family protein [Alphaproteobacteria bacterium]
MLNAALFSLAIASLLLAIPEAQAESPAKTAPPSYVTGEIADAAHVGGGRLTVMVWDVYDAALFAPGGVYSEEKPFALRLSYLRKLEGRKIADKSSEEIRRQGFGDEIKLAIWHRQMRSIFPDVQKGTSLTGIRRKDGSVAFYHNGKMAGVIDDPDFAPRFFAIWLAAGTSAPALRSALTGRR